MFRETFSLLMQSAYLDRCFTKPRGYAGDYFTIEMIYRDQATGAGRLGPHLDRWALNSTPCRAVRSRRAMLSQAIRDIVNRSPAANRIAITSIASGPAREILDVLTQPETQVVHATCVDIDAEALTFTANAARELNVSDRLTLAQDNVVHLRKVAAESPSDRNT